MQELKSIRNTTAFSIDSAPEKGVNWLAYDPQCEAVLAISQLGGASVQKSTVLRISDHDSSLDAVWEHHREAQEADQEEMKSKEHEALGEKSESAVQDDTNDIHQQQEIEGDSNQHGGVTSLTNQAVVSGKANPPGIPHYLKPQQIGDAKSGNKQPAAATKQEPDCLRFCPANSSSSIEMSLSGFTVKAIAPGQVARTNKGFHEGVHYWEIICPISLSTLQIGVSNKSQKEEVTQQFRTTTPRVVGIELNLEKLTLNFWLNGRSIKERRKYIPPSTAGQLWYPTVKFKEADYHVVLNPFAQGGKGYTPDESANQNYLPKALHSNEASQASRILATAINSAIAIYGLALDSESEHLERDIRKLLRLEVKENGTEDDKLAERVKIHFPLLKQAQEQPNQEAPKDKVASKVQFAVASFDIQKDSVKYYLKNKDLKLLNPRQIGNLIMSTSPQAASLLPPIKPGDKSEQLPFAIAKDVAEVVFTQVLGGDETLKLLTGLSSHVSTEQLASKLGLLKEAIDKKDIAKAALHPPSQVAGIHYLPMSDKMLLVGGEGLKLITREKGQFPINPSFSYPTVPNSLVSLDISLEQLSFLISHLDWKLVAPNYFDILAGFIDICRTSQYQNSIKVPFDLALIAVKILLNTALTQFELLEQAFESLEEQDVLHKFQPQNNGSASKYPGKDKQPVYERNGLELPFQTEPLSLLDAHNLLSITLGLEDQLWAMSQGNGISQSVKDMQEARSRIHTAYGRLSSLITFPLGPHHSISLMDLSEQGLVQTNDKYGQLQQFQNFRVELEDIFTEGSLTMDSLQSKLERQFPQNLMLAGFPTWNVPLSQTLNKFPPVAHGQGQKIDKVQFVSRSSQVLSASNDGSVNIWDTKVKMHKVADFNFKAQLQSDKLKDEKLLKRLLIEPKDLNEVGQVRIIYSSSSHSLPLPKAPLLAALDSSEITQLEDILFTMFEESADPNSKENNHDSGFEGCASDEEEIAVETHTCSLLDYIDQTPKEAIPLPKKDLEETKEDITKPSNWKKGSEGVPATTTKVKEEQKAEETTAIVPDQELVTKLIMMGFPAELCKKALVKVKNESLETAVEAVMELQEQESKSTSAQAKPVKPTGTQKILSYECSVCTLINKEGNAFCDACGSPAPATAIVFVKTEQEIQREKDEEERKIREEIEKIEAMEKERVEKELQEKLKEEQDRLQKEEEGKRIAELELLKSKTKEYFDGASIVDWFFSSIRGGSDVRPFISGAVMKSPFGDTHDIHIASFAYRHSYLSKFVNKAHGPKPKCQICDVPFLNAEKCVLHLLSSHRDTIEGLYPAFIQSNDLPMKAQHVATVLLPFEHLDHFVQIGDNLTESSPLFLLAIGRKRGDEDRSLIIEKIELSKKDSVSELLITTLTDSKIFSSQTDNFSLESITKLAVCQQSRTLFVELNGANVIVFNHQEATQRLIEDLSKTAMGSLLGVKNGILYTLSMDKTNVYRYQVLGGIREKEQLIQTQLEKDKNATREALEEIDILKMQVDPANVKVNDIRLYERLMSGQSVRAISNVISSKFPRAKNQSTIKNYFTKHHWTFTNGSQFDPLVMEFEKSTSLISLNLNMHFQCRDSAKLQERLCEQMKHLTLTERRISLDNADITKQPVHSQHDTFNLGLLSIHGQGSDEEEKVGDNSQSKPSLTNNGQSYLPLVVNHHKGASYNLTFQVSRVVMDNDKIFASNYPQPEFYFKHIAGQHMLIDKFTIRSNPISKCGASPIGSGIIFAADQLSSFEMTAPFHRFSLSDYKQWRQERLKDPTPLRQHEPVAYFEFDSDHQVIVEPDCRRMCKYLFLKPTGFRKKPNAFTQKMSVAPLEIEFFGVSGTSQDVSDLHTSSPDRQDITIHINSPLNSQISLELSILGDDNRVLKTIQSVPVHSLIGGSSMHTISPKVLCTSSTPIDLTRNALTGQTYLSITDSHLQLQEIRGLKITLSQNGSTLQDSPIWNLQGIQVEAIAAGSQSNSTESISSAPLFSMPQVPLSYMRSCLLSPKFYNVVNTVLARLSFSEAADVQLRNTIIQFLNRLMQLNKEFIPLLQKDINLNSFLDVNLFGPHSSSIQLVVDFLQNFSRDIEFCNDLYQILLNYIDKVPDTLMNYSGYEALVGMVKWAVPINPERTLAHLVNVLYSKICLKKLQVLQTPEYIRFRTRSGLSSFPFDFIGFKRSQKKDQLSQTALTLGSSASKFILPLEEMKRTVLTSHHLFDIKLAKENLEVSEMRLFIGLLPGMDSVLFKLIVKILGENDELLLFKTFEEQIFAQFANPIKQNGPTASVPLSNTDCLHLSNLGIKNQRLIKVVIEFATSFSSVPKASQKTTGVETMIEVYGHSVDTNDTQSSLKALLDKRAQEYWQRSGKLYSVGRCIQMLSIATDPSESTFVPQGSQATSVITAVKEAKSNQEGQDIQARKHTVSELSTLQSELVGKLKANDKSNIEEIVEKIGVNQILIDQLETSDYLEDSVVPSLEYYLVIASDFTKLIRSLIKHHKQDIGDLTGKVLREIEGDLSKMAFEIFKRFVVFDSQIKQDALSFITDCINPLMTKDETKALTFKIIEDFLSKPHDNFSQVAVLQSLSSLGIPEGELISFMVSKLSIPIKGKKDLANSNDIQPFVFISSVLMLALESLKKISIPEPGQALHKGIPCNGCPQKHIIGWRYKCGHCSGNVNFDSKCASKHIIEHPDHVLLIIKEPLTALPLSTQLKQEQKQAADNGTKNASQPILPVFEFKDDLITQEVNNAMTHEGSNCEHCGKKPIVGNLYKCANCEDYSLCEQCFESNGFSHFAQHIFLKLHKPLKNSDQSPTILLQMMDPRLYPVVQLTLIQSNILSQQELEDEDSQDLLPMAISRSLSVPMHQKFKKNGAKQPSAPASKQQSIYPSYDNLDCDQQFVILFNVSVWLTQDQQGIKFAKEEKIVLLKLLFETLLELIKLASLKHILEVIANKEAFFQILVVVLNLNSPGLIQLFKQLFDNFRQPPLLVRRLKEVALHGEAKKLQMEEDTLTHKKLIQQLISHMQVFLKWLIDLGLDHESARFSALQGQDSWALLLQSYLNQRIWLEHLSLILEFFIKTNDELKIQQKGADGLEKIHEEEVQASEEEELAPLTPSRSVSLPLTARGPASVYQPQNQQSLQLIKNLVQLISDGHKINGGMANGKMPKHASHFREYEPKTKYLSQMWALVLKSLTAVSVNQLIEAKIFDSLVNAFLQSSEEIKQITYPQILAITEIIATQSVSSDISRFICNLLFLTLDNITYQHEKVGYSICQGWLDILIGGTTARTQDQTSKTIFAKMSEEEVSTYLLKSTQYLLNNLNKCSFEGVTGANMTTVMRLNLAADLLYVIRYAESKTKAGTPAIQELFGSLGKNARLQRDFQESMNNLILWLFLNARQAKDDQITSQLGNSSSLTPSTSKVKYMTELIEELFSLLAESESCEQAIKIALHSMTQIVRKLNKSLVDLTSTQQLGQDVAVRLSERTNEYFTKLLGQWLISDTIASYFVFDLEGFEFLLDTIGVGFSDNTHSEEPELAASGFKESELIDASGGSKQIEQGSLGGSDLSAFLESKLIDFSSKALPTQPDKQTQKAAADKTPKSANVVVSTNVFERPVQAQLQEYSKTMTMIGSNGADVMTTYSKTDWSVNKRAYKHRIIIKHLQGALRHEYWLLFQLAQPVELKEIQIAFTNYWAADTEVYAEPLSVLVEAGMEENNLSLVCNLQIVKDDAFGSVSATIFGSNLQTFGSQSEKTSGSIEELIQQRLSSLPNFKAQYIKFRMRKHVLTCLENSPLAVKFTKQPAFAINYISLLGFEATREQSSIVQILRQEQKKTALEVLSLICSGDFSSILKVISNQEKTIDKIKSSFSLLADLLNVKANLIEPTFIAISTHNTEMGDWIINQFLKGSKNNRNASLVGEIVICNQDEMPRRLNLLKDFVMSQLKQIAQVDRSQHGTLIQKIIPFASVLIQALRISAPDILASQRNDLQGGPFFDLSIKESHLVDIISLLSSTTSQREHQSKVLIQLLILFLSPPLPFTNSNLSPFEFTVKHLLDPQFDEQETHREVIASILAASKTLIAKEILERGVKLDIILRIPDEDIEHSKPSKGGNVEIQTAAKFWLNVTQDSAVKAKLAQEKLPLKLYQNIRSPNPESTLKIIRNDSFIGDTELDLMIELIKHLISGELELENELAAMLMKDLEHMSKFRDMSFVNKVFLPLLRNEKTLPVCLWPFDSENKKWLSQYKPDSLQVRDGHFQDSQSLLSHSNFIPSQLLQGEKRSALIKNFKEIVGSHSKGGVKKFLSTQTWTLAHSQTEQGQVTQFASFWKNIENKAPVIALISGISSSGSNLVFGCYCSKGIPSVPSNLQQDAEYPVAASPEDFVFCYIDDSSFHHFQPKQGLNILSMFTDYEGGGAISVANEFMVMSFSYDFQFSVGNQLDVDKIQEASNPKPVKQVENTAVTFQKFEVWSPSSVANVTKDQLKEFSSNAIAKSAVSTSSFNNIGISSEEGQSSLGYDIVKHPWINVLSPYQNYRTNPVFMVPSHLTLSQLSKILLDSSVVSFKARSFQKLNPSGEMTVSQLINQLDADVQVKESANAIIDLEYEINQLVASSNAVQEEPEDPFTAESSGLVTGYVPKMGVFERFEDLGGVRAIIQATLASLRLWKGEEHAKSWELWLRELESFSEIPLFFQLFLKNTRCKDLLFKVLAGLPDSEISTTEGKAKWEEEQKAAVQFNYKILSEAFSISNDVKLRETAMKSGLLPRILDRLAQISGEKPRVYDDAEEAEEKKTDQQQPLMMQQAAEKNTDRKKRKGVGYSSKVGQTFNVTQYLENKKQRNEQIKNLIDICSNFINCKDWDPTEDVLQIIYESALLPLIESAFRNGSWLEMAKEHEVYHSYLALARALAQQKNLIPCLGPLDPKYKPTQTEPIYKLLHKLNDLAEIFINCLNQQTKSDQSNNAMTLLSASYKNHQEDQKDLYIPNQAKNMLQPYDDLNDQDEPGSSINLWALKNVGSLNKIIDEGSFEETKTVSPHSSHMAKTGEIEGSESFFVQKIKDSILKQQGANKGAKGAAKVSKQSENDILAYNSPMLPFLLNPYPQLPTIEQDKDDSNDSDQPIGLDHLKQPAKPVKKKKQVESSDESDDDQEYETYSEGTAKDEDEQEKSIESEKQPPQKIETQDKAITDDDESSFETISEESYGPEEQKGPEGAGGEVGQGHKIAGKLQKLTQAAKKFKAKKKVKLPSLHDESDSDSSSSSSHSSSESDSSITSDSDVPDLMPNDDGSSDSNTDGDEDDVSEGSSDGTELFSQDTGHAGKNVESTDQMDSEIPENLARDVIKTFRVVQAAVQKNLTTGKDENFIENALNLPAPHAYRSLLQDLRFDYMDMREDASQGATYKHHFQQQAAQSVNPPPSKMVRLAQELADLSNALPYEHTNAIFVRVDSQRVDLMKALICGASKTPYAHGCFEYDIFCDNNYPREPPKMILITTGGGSVRFNPNLYACGKVCLSLLGTWRGSATENWDPKLSTILQVLLSTQAIIMSEEVYFNEPGFENEAGTVEGEKKNEGYQNIVRYCNVKFAMVGQIKTPPKGFESVVRRHFYIKKAEILKEVHEWVELAEKNEAAYTGLVNDHNYTWATQFKASRTKYREMLVAVVTELEEALNLLERPTDYELKLQSEQRKRAIQQQTAKKQKRQAITEGKAELNDIDVATDDEEEKNETTLINTEAKESINVEDEAVKDRWSRYIGAMGIEAVAKQSAANIFLSGAGALGIEIAKNLVLAGCKSFTLHDNKPITYRDLSGQFFLNYEEDVLKKHLKSRAEACLPRLKQLNYYVKCHLAPTEPLPTTESDLALWGFPTFDVVILTEATNAEIYSVSEFCRKHSKKLIVADAYGVFTRVVNDFGEKFEVMDKNGEELQDVMIKSIDNESGLVELLPHTKHKFEDGDEVLITKVDGMKLLEGKEQEDPAVKSDSINDTIHKVQVLTPYSFKINGDLTRYHKYELNGIAKQLKTKKLMTFKSFPELTALPPDNLPLDENLAIADFEKMGNNHLAHLAFEALDEYRVANKGGIPGAWNRVDCERFVGVAKGIRNSEKYSKCEAIRPADQWFSDDKMPEVRFLSLFALTASGTFNPLCAFQGGVIAQEVVKAITQKFSPIGQLFYYDALEVLPTEFDPKLHLSDSQEFDKLVASLNVSECYHRSDGLRIILGGDMLSKLAHTRLFMVGAGAIGCELLKNYAMLGVGTAKGTATEKAGAIVLTDPDVIEVSNLNRQFLFREKHLRLPKSQTAAAAAINMNRELKDNIVARLDKVHEGTSHIFTDQFFEGLTVVTNALDNVHARRYIDSRCVVARTPLLESGTLGPKGHVQVVLPFKTESYGSQNDPEDNTEIPHCTLKMFPEETLHCIEWAKDKFGKVFTLVPQNALKLLEEASTFVPTSQEDTKNLKKVLKLLKHKPLTFGDCLQYARHKFEKLFNHDIRQLLHVYPLDAKTKEGAPFWSLPKRPPTPIEFNPKDALHCQYVTAIACLRANVFRVEIPSKQPRGEAFREECGIMAAKYEVEKFVPNDEKAKEIQASVQKEEKKQEEEVEEIVTTTSEESSTEELLKEFKAIVGSQKSSEVIQAELFEKDNDQNFHIDAIYSMGNCRALNYALDPMDWLTVKLKAGRIVPALATTTAAVAGLQTLELVKLLKGCSKGDHRNVFLNLAVPIMQASEPGDVGRNKLCEGIESTLWDRWDVKGHGVNTTLKDVVQDIEARYTGLEVRDVMRGNTPLYFHAIMSASGKEKEKEKTLNSKVAELLGLDTADDKYVDLNITCIKKGEEQQIISGVPTVRVYFE